MPQCLTCKGFYLKQCAKCSGAVASSSSSPAPSSSPVTVTPHVVVAQKPFFIPSPKSPTPIGPTRLSSPIERATSPSLVGSAKPLSIVPSPRLGLGAPIVVVSDVVGVPVLEAPRVIVPPSAEPNKSSAVPTGQMNAFVEGLVAVDPSLGFPVFSISDNNSFHTSGYLWGLYAVKKLKAKGLPVGPIAIVNFDSHADADAPKNDVVASDRWGVKLVDTIVAEGFPKACYVSTFNHPRGTGGRVVARGGIGEAPGKPAVAEDLTKVDEMGVAFTDFWAKMATYFDAPVKYVFFTIDRDVLRNSFTQWGDGAIQNKDQLVNCMRAALTPLGILTGGVAPPTASLIGFDVTGLPESGALIRKPADGWQMETAVWDALTAELVAARAFANDHMSRPDLSTLSNVLFYSGSVAYKGQMGDDIQSFNCWSFVSKMSGVAKGLGTVLSAGTWSYLLCRQKAPIYNHAWKPFSLYRPVVRPTGNPSAAKIGAGVGTAVGGFSCTASVSIPSALKDAYSNKDLVPCKSVQIADMKDKTGEFTPGLEA